MPYPLSYGGAPGVSVPYPTTASALDRAHRPVSRFTPATRLFAALPLALTLLSLVAARVDVPSPQFVAHTAADATPRSGRVTSIETGWSVKLAGPDAAVPAGQLVSLRRTDRPLPPWPRGPRIVLANGDRVGGTVTGGDARAVRFTPDAKAGGPRGEWSVPLSALAAVWLTPPPADAPPDPAAYPWADTPRRRDAVLLTNGDVVRGTVEGFTADPAAVTVKPPAGGKAPADAATTLPLSRVAAISFDPTLARVRKPKGPFARLVTADGSRVGLASATSDSTTLKGTTLFGAAVEVPLADVIVLDVLQGKAVYLSDLKPKKATVEGFNGVAWPWAADRTVKGNPLRLGAQTFDKGLGTHPRTTLTYTLGGKYRRFEALVGLDPVTGRRGVADVRVLVDGKEVPVERLTGLTAAGPRAVSTDVTGAKELTLVVDYGPAGDVQDDVNWCDARLIE